MLADLGQRPWVERVAAAQPAGEPLSQLVTVLLVSVVRFGLREQLERPRVRAPPRWP